MNHPEMARRLQQAMELAAISSVPKLARKTGIDRGYLYRLSQGEIRTPHKYLDTLAEAMGVSPHWLGAGIGEPYDHERTVPRHRRYFRTVTVVPNEGDSYDIEAEVPNIFSSHRHIPVEEERYRYLYVPETNDYFPAYTLLTVEQESRPGPGFFVAWINGEGRKRLGSFVAHYQGMDCVYSKDPDMEVIGRVRNMDYWQAEPSEEVIRK
ncbi:helix-turn-helix domain-containing protein [Endozoicomonas sp.]|uniref:helix-turn-helix domain-containing protein n=3 Tax=Endozoicomonas TaxID=305899 RepID=UPI003AF57B56